MTIGSKGGQPSAHPRRAHDMANKKDRAAGGDPILRKSVHARHAEHPTDTTSPIIQQAEARAWVAYCGAFNAHAINRSFESQRAKAAAFQSFERVFLAHDNQTIEGLQP